MLQTRMMANRNERPITLPLLDRLIDHEPKQSEELPVSRADSVRKFREAVRRDLEWLLNTRQAVIAYDEDSQLENSLLSYGLPDISALSSRSVQDRQRLTDAIHTVIEKFEPRIANVRVILAEMGEAKLPVLTFVIEGALRMDPGAEYVSFNTVLDLANKEYKI
ncbi:MAG: type VI secretion system baseplate subunit TssE, partial [Bryobacteraceae bacterium]